MPRIGQNPLRYSKVTPLARIVVLVVTHLPDQVHDYHKTRLEVIQRSLKTLTENIQMDPKEYDLIVWDNGSCQELREWLDTWVCKRMYSCNIGKTNALKMIMRMLPPGSILAYADDDMEYFPNWLAPQIEILTTFPRVGTVTGWPVRVTGGWGEAATLTWAREHARVERGAFVPAEWERDYCAGVGADWEEYKTRSWGLMDTRITYQGVSALAMSQHCQFVCFPERVERFVEWSDLAMPKEAPFDKAVDAAGLLRLATVDRLTRHLGNVLDAPAVTAETDRSSHA